jgi:hypothetical protein
VIDGGGFSIFGGGSLDRFECPKIYSAAGNLYRHAERPGWSASDTSDLSSTAAVHRPVEGVLRVVDDSEIDKTIVARVPIDVINET